MIFLCLVICNYIRRNYCKYSADLVCLNISSNFTNIHGTILYMEKLKKNININRIQPHPLCITYVDKLYALFNIYFSEIIYKNNICILFNHIVSNNTICFSYYNACLISDNVISYFVKCG